jgi:hypothetical protein
MLIAKKLCHDQLALALVTRFFASGSFHESVSPQPQSIPFRPFRIFSKIRGNIRSSTPVANGKNLQSEKL